MAKILGHQKGDLLSEKFGQGITKDPFRSGVREQDDALVVDADDGIRGILCYHAEQFAGVVDGLRAFMAGQVLRIPSLGAEQ